MTLSEMRRLLDERGLRLTKSLGQNFLHDGNQLRRIVGAAELNAGDAVLEIGPGLGPLTELLLARPARVLAIEKDRRLVALLQERFGAALAGGTLELRHEDALEFLRSQPRDWSRWKLVSNLPYSVASPILVELAQAAAAPERIVATVQWEVARRLVAPAGSGDYGVLSLLVQARFEGRGTFKIPAACFFPPPDVDSACVTLARRPEALLSETELPAFTALVKRSFSQRRKMMFKLLKDEWPAARLGPAFDQARLSQHTRAEEVSLAQFVQLTRTLAGLPSP